MSSHQTHRKLLSTTNHGRDDAALRYVYPVVSRRAGGVSVGINLNPNNACNWRCIYCQVPDLTRGAAPAIDLTILEAELRGFEFRLMQALGYFPDIDSDAHSGMPIQADGHYQFVINSGFVACAESARDSVSGRTVIDWARGEYRQDAVLRLAKSVLRSTIDFNLHGKTLKSRDVSAEILKLK